MTPVIKQFKIPALLLITACMLFNMSASAEQLKDVGSQIATPCSKAETAEHNGLYANDPMIRISALPIDKNIDDVLVSISEDVSKETGLSKEFITYYWANLSNINCMGKKATKGPILVDLYVPGFLTTETIGKIMTSLAASLERHTGIEKEWVFIHTHFPRQKNVYISGQIQTWDDYQGDKE